MFILPIANGTVFLGTVTCRNEELTESHRRMHYTEEPMPNPHSINFYIGDTVCFATCLVPALEAQSELGAVGSALFNADSQSCCSLRTLCLDEASFLSFCVYV